MTLHRLATPPSAPRRAAKYRRISDDPEGRRLGLDRQDEDLDRLAAARGYTVVASYADNDIGASTRTTTPRPGYRQMIADARTGTFDVILAYTTSRLTRRPLEHETQIDLAERHGVTFDYVRSPSFDLNTADGRVIARILAAQDAAESERISERVRRANVQRARDGMPSTGGPRPYGWHPDRTTVDPVEAAEIVAAFEQVVAGVPLSQIVRDLRQRGVATVTGAGWTTHTLRGILLNPRAAGIVVHQGRVVDGAAARWDPIVDRDLFDAVTAVLTDPARTTTSGGTPRYLGSNLYLCGHPSCADRTVTLRSSGRPGARWTQRVYRCRESAHLTRAAAPLDGYVANVVVRRLARPDAADLLPTVDGDADTRRLRSDAETLRRKLAGALRLWRDDVFTDAEYAHERVELERRLVAVEARLRPARVSPLAGIAGRPDAAAVWEAMPLGRRRAVLAATLTVTVLPRGKGRLPAFEDPGSYRVDIGPPTGS